MELLSGSKYNIEEVVELLKKEELFYDQLELEIQEEKLIRDLMIEQGTRQIVSSGYDVLSDKFYAVDKFQYYGHIDERDYLKTFEFDSFASYEAFLGQDIYTNSDFFQLDIKRYKIPNNIDIDKLLAVNRNSEQIDSYTLEPSLEEFEIYKEGLKNKKLCQPWLTKLNNCKTVEQFEKVLKNLRKSKCPHTFSLIFFITNYLNAEVDNMERLDIVMKYLSHYHYHDMEVLKQLVYMYGGDTIVNKYNYDIESTTTNNKKKKVLKTLAQQYSSSEKKVDTTYVYIDKIGYFIREDRFIDTQYNTTVGCKISYFNTIDDVLKSNDNSLKRVNASNHYELKLDLADMQIDKTTILPPHLVGETSYVIKKYCEDNKFRVDQIWKNTKGVQIKYYSHGFDLFSQFCHFLNNDLSDTNLIECDGLLNLTDLLPIDFTNCKVTSEVAHYLGIDVEKVKLEEMEVFDELISNEKEKINNIEHRELVSEIDKDLRQRVINYVSDIHVEHKIIEHNCQTENDIDYLLLKITKQIINSSKSSLIIINGDTTSEYKYFEKFVNMLRIQVDKFCFRPTIIFTLGNHELWSFPENELNEITNKYEELLKNNGMFLLQNSILYQKGLNNSLKCIPEDQLSNLTKQQLRDILDGASLVLFGGIGFSGLNLEFNANSGIYRDTVDRNKEVIESEKFEKLYKFVTNTLDDKNLIIATHMPTDCWTSQPIFKSNYTYINGHTHRNEFCDDGMQRIYADNQSGYKSKNVTLRYLVVDGNYELFTDLEDGIHSITIDQYNDYMRAKNISGHAGEAIYKLHMVKREEYYCFVSESKDKSFCILNGGRKKKLKTKDINYIYNNMMHVIRIIEEPLFKFKDYQTQIALAIKEFGGDGRIHGCIIDIDYYNHIHVDPSNGLITPYYASNIKNKLAYPSIEQLLRDNNTILYNNYKKLLTDNRLPETISKLETTVNEIQFNSDTSMYRASNEILKMQKLTCKTLTVWTNAESNSLKLS